MGIFLKMTLTKKKPHMEEEVERNPSHTLEDACENWYVHRHGKVYVMPTMGQNWVDTTIMVLNSREACKGDLYSTFL
jgi:hypothetical protein